jgi:hypothetical protein
MTIDPTAFRPVGSIVFGTARTKRFPTALDSQLIRITPVLGPAPAGKKDNRKTWARAGGLNQIDRAGAAIKQQPIDLTHPLLFRPDRELMPYYLSFWRHSWVTPLTLRIDKYLLTLNPEDHSFNFEFESLEFE